MDFETIQLDVSDHVATVTLHRPERMNAWNARMGRELSEMWDRLDADDSVRAAVLTGAGRAFCAGADLSTAGGDTFSGRGAGGDDGQEVGGRLRLPWSIRKPVIAAINGHAVGVGITYPLTADVRFVAGDAKLQFAFVRRGVLPELSSHVILRHVAGLSVAADLLLSGRMFSGHEAVELGLASRALPAGEVLPAALEWARDVATNAAPASVAAAKQLLWAGLVEEIETSARREDRLFGWLGDQADAKEGIASFLEKREPVWSLSASDLPGPL